jgi:serine protease
VGTVCGADRSDIIEGMLWAAGVSYQGNPGFANNPLPARVISLSYGSSGDCSTTMYSQVVATLKQRGTLLVASAGNGNSSNVGDVTPTVPASCPGVLAVTALHQRVTKASYANFVQTSGSLWGLAVSAGDVSDPSDSAVYTLTNNGTEGASPFFSMKRLAGTSFAAPQAAGLVALMLALNPGLTVDQVLTQITSSARSWASVQSDLTTSGQAGGLGTCSPGVTGACKCTASTCGSGVLDAGQSVRDVIAALPGTIVPFEPPAVTASYFVPDRTQSRSSSSSCGGGGGGAMSWPWGLALYMLLAGTWLASRMSARNVIRSGRP